MPLKEAFLSYVELQRCANESKAVNGSEHKNTVDAYEKANLQKRKVLNLIESLETALDNS